MTRSGSASPGAESTLGRILSGDRFWIGVVLATALFASCHTVVDPDLWFHLRAGREIAGGAGPPRVDSFTYPSAGRPYVDLHWIYQVVLWWIYQIAGVRGLVLAQIGFALSTYGGLYKLTRHHTSAISAGTLCLLAVVLGSERMHARPECVSYLFLVCTQWMVQRAFGARPRLHWGWIPLLFALWANVEGLFVLGLGIVGASAIEHWRDRRRWGVLFLATAATILNPYLVRGALHPLLLWSRVSGKLPLYSETIGEFLSPFQGDRLHPSVALFPWYLALILALAAARGRLPRLSQLVIVVAFGLLAVGTRRNVAILPLVATPILGAWWRDVASNVRAKGWRIPGARGIRRAGVALVILLAARLSAAFALNQIYARAETNMRFGIGLSDVAFPVESARFIRENKIGGPYFATMAAGDYLLHALPEQQQFIDGRLEVHSEAHYERYLRMLQGGAEWRRASAEFGVRCLVLPTLDAPALLAAALRDSQWVWVHTDEAASVFVRRDVLPPGMVPVDPRALGGAPWDLGDPLPGTGPRIPLLVDPRRHDFPWAEVARGELLLTAGLYGQATRPFADAVRRGPIFAAPRILLASALANGGRVDEADRVLAGAETGVGSARARARGDATLGLIRLSTNRPKEAEGAYTRALFAIQGGPERASLLVNRGLARLILGRAVEAREDVQAGLALAPGYLDGYRILGLIEERQGNREAARRAYLTYVSNGGQNPAVVAALGRLR